MIVISLQIWLPLLGNLTNNGVGNYEITNANAAVDNSGKLGQCYSFNGSSSRLYNNNVSISNNAMSGACWVKLSALTRSYLFSLGGNSSITGAYQQIGIWIESNGHPWVCGMGSELDSGYTLTTDKWYHLCMTYSGSTSKLYINGSLVFTGTNANTKQTRTKFCVGARSNTDTGASTGIALPLNGKLNDVRIYDHCLSPKEVEILARGLILHYPMTGGGKSQGNLYQGTFDFSGSWGNSGSWTTDTETHNEFIVKKRTGQWAGLHQNILATKGDKFTISFWAKVESGGTITSIHRSNLGNVTTGLSILGGNFASGDAWVTTGTDGTKWKYYWGALEVTSTDITYVQWRIENSVANKTMWICGFKFERGDKPTPWVPYSNDSQYSAMGYNDNTEYDVSGYLHNGTINGSVSYSSDTPRYSVSTHFNASNTNYITIPAITVDMKNITFSAWGKFDTTNNWMRIFDFGQAASGGGYGIIISNGASGSGGKGLTLVILGSGGTSLLNQVVYTITTGAWFHVAVTILDSSVKVYVNGNLEKTYTVTTLSTATPLNLNYIGKSNWSDPYLTGNVSDFRLYATALTADNIKELYNTPVSLTNNGRLLTQGSFVET